MISVLTSFEGNLSQSGILGNITQLLFYPDLPYFLTMLYSAREATEEIEEEHPEEKTLRTGTDDDINPAFT